MNKTWIISQNELMNHRKLIIHIEVMSQLSGSSIQGEITTIRKEYAYGN